MPVSSRHLTESVIRKNCICLPFFLLMVCSVFPQEYNLRIFTTEDGLAQSYVYSVIQDDRGCLWVGTGNGLSRYNGSKFENYSTNDSLSDNFITCAWREGTSLWFGHMNGTLTRFDGKKYFAVDLPGSDGSPITHFAENRNGEVWVSSYSGALWKLGGQVSTTKQYSLNEQLDLVTFEFIDSEELLIGTTAGLMRCKIKEPGSVELISAVKEMPEIRITCMQKMKRGTGFYVTTEDDSIYILESNAGRFRISSVCLDPGSAPTGIQQIYEDSRSNLWLATFGTGLVKIVPDSSGKMAGIEILNKDHGFPAEHVKILFEDREGNIWCGTYGEGLIQLTNKTFSVFKPDKSFTGGNIFSIYIDKQHRWLGTENGLIKMDQSTGKVSRFYSINGGLPKDTVTAIYSSDGKILWIGTDKHGVFLMDVLREKIVKYPLGYGELENSITAIGGNRDLVWIGTKKGLCAVNQLTAQITWYTINHGGLPHNVVNCLHLDKSGRLWVSTNSNILSYIQHGKIYKIPVNTIVGSLMLGPITEDADSCIWVGSNGQGVFKINTDSIARITKKDGLLSDYCYSIFGDDQKNVWVGHKDGLSRIRTTDFSVKPIEHIEGLKDSYQFNSNAVYKDHRKKIWFGSNKGLVCYDPSMEYPRYVPPVLSIISLKVNDIERNLADVIVLPPGIYKISIEYLGVSLREPELVTYQYKLVGYDQLPEYTKNNSVTYNHLTEGQYEFTVSASSGDGINSETPVVLGIIIKKSIWKKWWFYLLIFCTMSGLIFGYIKRREYWFKLEKAELEEKVRLRTLEIQRQKDEIELQRDMIHKRNENITSSIMYASHIQNSVLPPFELIERLIPDSFILSKPKDIVSGDFYWFAEKGHKIVMALADCTGHGVPGAFMSLLGITFLNEIINAKGITRSDDIVTNLRKRVSHSLQQSRKYTSTNDGIDIALCVFDQKQRTIQFTGGMNDLVYIHEGALRVVQADNISVSVLMEDSGPFTMKEIDVMKGDIFYLFSDGYQDQFGGERNKKYLRHRFFEKLLEIHALPMNRQKEILEKDLSDWMGDNIQTDDITVIGIRF